MSIGLKKWIIFFGVMLFFASIFLKEALSLDPVDDSLLALSFGERPVISFFTRNFVTLFPSYRPLGQLSIWAQYQVIGLHITWSYYLVNNILWSLCCAIAGVFIYKHTKSYLISFLFAGLLLTDLRTIAFVSWITERQNLLMILFGLSAIMWTQHIVEKKKVSLLQIAVIGLLLLGSAMSKEYGLAFSLAIGTYVYFVKQPTLRRLYVAPVFALVSYVLLRLLASTSSVGDIVGLYCEDMGFFFKTNYVCYYKQNFFANLLQYGYNIAASFVGSFLPALFDEYGKIKAFSAINHPLLLLNAIITASFWYGFKRSKPLKLLLLLIVWGSMFGFMIYRTRNQFASIAPIYMGAGIGFALYWKQLKKTPEIIKWAIGAYFLTWLFSFGFTVDKELRRLHAYYNRGYICHTLRAYPHDISIDIVRQLGVKYSIDTTGCIAEAEELRKQ